MSYVRLFLQYVYTQPYRTLQYKTIFNSAPCLMKVFERLKRETESRRAVSEAATQLPETAPGGSDSASGYWRPFLVCVDRTSGYGPVQSRNRRHRFRIEAFDPGSGDRASACRRGILVSSDRAFGYRHTNPEVTTNLFSSHVYCTVNIILDGCVLYVYCSCTYDTLVLIICCLLNK